MAESTWIRTAGDTYALGAPLSGDTETDAIIVGGGLAGMTAAYLLAKAGMDTALLAGASEKSASAHTTGFITQNIDTPLADLERMFGRAEAQLIWRTGADAIDHIETTIRDEGIECEFVRCPLYEFATNEDEWESLDEEASLARSLGFDASARQGDALPFANAGYLRVENQAKFHALKYLAGLRRAAERGGARIYDASATALRSTGDSLVIETPAGRVRAQKAFIATYYPFTDPKSIFGKTGTYATYVIEAEIKRGALPEALYQDVKNPYHYFRIDRVGDEETDRLIYGGADHRREITVDENKNFGALQEFMQGILPNIELREITRWKWGIIEPIDGLPLIGLIDADAREFIATGLSGTGMTGSRVAAEMFAQYAQGGMSPLEKLYHPLRMPTPYQLMKKGADYVGEFFGGAAKNVFRR